MLNFKHNTFYTFNAFYTTYESRFWCLLWLKDNSTQVTYHTYSLIFYYKETSYQSSSKSRLSVLSQPLKSLPLFQIHYLVNLGKPESQYFVEIPPLPGLVA